MLETFSLEKYNDALSRGLARGKGGPNEQMCIEAAICYAFGLPHDDDLKCVSSAVRKFTVRLNGSKWSSPEARAEGLRNLGLAQLGSLGVINDVIFVQKLALANINKLVPPLFRKVFIYDTEMLELALQCEKASLETAYRAASDAYRAARTVVNVAANVANAAKYAANAATQAASVAYYAASSDAVSAAIHAAAYARCADNAALYAADVAALYAADVPAPDKYLKMSANIALDILKEMDSPGCQFLTR